MPAVINHQPTVALAENSDAARKGCPVKMPGRKWTVDRTIPTRCVRYAAIVQANDSGRSDEAEGCQHPIIAGEETVPNLAITATNLISCCAASGCPRSAYGRCLGELTRGTWVSRRRRLAVAGHGRRRTCACNHKQHRQERNSKTHLTHRTHGATDGYWMPSHQSQDLWMSWSQSRARQDRRQGFNGVALPDVYARAA